MFFEDDCLYLEAPTDKRILCPDCKGDPSGIHYRELITCRECDGEGCIGIRQCHSCNTEGRILVDRRGCRSCSGHGMQRIHVDDIHDPLFDGTVLTPGEVTRWQQSVLDLFEPYSFNGRPSPGKSGSAQEGTIVFHELGELWKGSEARTLVACMKQVYKKRRPYGPFCFFEDEVGHLCLQIFPPRRK